MTKEYSKVAVVSCCEKIIGGRIIKKLLNDGFFVFTLGTKAEIKDYQHLEGVRTFLGNMYEMQDCVKLKEVVINTCDELGVKPQVNLLINNPNILTKEHADGLTDRTFARKVRHASLTVFNSTELFDLMTYAAKTRIINIYPKAKDVDSASIAHTVSIAALDSMTSYISKMKTKSHFTINSICPEYKSIPKEIGAHGMQAIFNTLDFLMEESNKRVNGNIYHVTPDSRKTYMENLKTEVLNV